MMCQAVIRRWYKGRSQLVCGALAKRCGRRAFCVDHWPAVVS